MERSEQRRIVEALVLASPEPVTAARLASVVPDATASLARELVAELNRDYAEHGRAFEIAEVAGGYQLRTRVDLASYVRELQPRRAVRLSRASLETLAVIAYKQPVTRAEIEHVRGVDAGAVLRSLLERDLVRIAGHREIPGRPMLYATTRRFLEVFGLASLEDLPTLRDLAELAAAAEAGAVDESAREEASPEASDAEDLEAPGAELDPADELDDELDLAGTDADDGDDEPLGEPH